MSDDLSAREGQCHVQQGQRLGWGHDGLEGQGMEEGRRRGMIPQKER